MDKSFCKIDYITIILSGKSGVGKSTLINALLKENLALESIPKVGTQKIASYQNKKITFLKMIDTRGVELIKKYGNENISNDINKVIDTPNTLNQFSFINKQSYNDNIQCLWYCVNKKKLEEQDIEMLSKFKKNQDQLPIIIVFTKAKDQELVEKMRKCVKEKLGDLPFHDLIAKDFDNVDTSYGLEDLIFLTLEQCKLAVKGDIFNDIKKIIYDTIADDTKKDNEKLSIKFNNDIANKFYNNYNKVILDNNMFKKYIYDLIVFIIKEYIKFDENQNVQISFNKSLLFNFIDEYIAF